MEMDLDRVRKNAAKATTEDLLDRVTVYRLGMEPEALDIIEEELRNRGIDAKGIADHAASRSESIQLADGSAMKCSFCCRPAVVREWGWHRLWGVVPVFPRVFAFCDVHRRSAGV